MIADGMSAAWPPTTTRLYLPAAFFVAQYFLTPSLIFLMAAALIFFLAGAPLPLFETVALPNP
jgi:hypothetical protein